MITLTRVDSKYIGLVRCFDTGDRVRVEIPDTEDPDFDPWHGRHGEVVEVIEDDAGSETGDERDSVLYRVQFDNGEEMDFRWRDLRPSGLENAASDKEEWGEEAFPSTRESMVGDLSEEDG
nr:hypothetical protein [Natrinema ejinorense]